MENDPVEIHHPKMALMKCGIDLNIPALYQVVHALQYAIKHVDDYSIDNECCPACLKGMTGLTEYLTKQLEEGMRMATQEIQIITDPSIIKKVIN